MLKVIVLIPCYNEEKSIDRVIHNIVEYSIKYRRLYPDRIIDYIVMNDCSNDNTLDKCRKSGYSYLNLPVNLGIGGCMQTGYQYALAKGYDIAVQHDGDGQHDPRDLGDLIQIVQAGQADIVIGSRFLIKSGFQSSGLRRLGISFLSKLIYICTGAKIYDVTSGCRAVNREYIAFFAKRYAQDYPEPESIVDAALNNAVIKEVPVVMHERKEGCSSISAAKSLYYMFKVSLAILLHRLIAPKGRGRAAA